MPEKTALVVVDMLNPYDFEDAEKLIDRAGERYQQVIYVNDNYGDWDSSREELIESALRGKRPDLVEPILPPEGCDFGLKARRSASSTARSTPTCATTR